MVKKLLKYEFISYLRTLVPMYIIMLAAGFICRVVQIFENDHFSYGIVFGSTVLALVLSIFVCFVMTTIVGVVRFYKNLYTAEGYLSFTLPVTSGQHIFTKLVTVITFTLIGVVVAVLSASTAMLGDVLVEVIKAGAYLLKILFDAIDVNLIFYIIEFAVLLLLALVGEFLLYYGCITIGQTARKNRILMAFGVYLIYYTITQVIGTIVAIVGMFFGEMGVLDTLGRIMEEHPIPSVHVILLSSIAFSIVLSVVYYFVIRHIMNRKLNLE